MFTYHRVYGAGRYPRCSCHRLRIRCSAFHFRASSLCTHSVSPHTISLHTVSPCTKHIVSCTHNSGAWLLWIHTAALDIHCYRNGGLIETCVKSVLLYGCESWTITDSILDQLERFQCEIGKRTLRVTRHFWQLKCITSSWFPTMQARITATKLSYLLKVVSSYQDMLSHYYSYQHFPLLKNASDWRKSGEPTSHHPDNWGPTWWFLVRKQSISCLLLTSYVLNQKFRNIQAWSSS